MVRLVGVGALAALALLASGSAPVQARESSGCPQGALPLSGTNPIAPAANAALRKVPTKEKPQVRGANLATADLQRGRQVRYQCGQAVAARTVVVYILRRAYLPAQSASQGVYFVSRFANGYRVWQTAH